MQSIEVTAKNLEEAKKQAAAQLGVDAGSLEVTVLEETKGLFGKSNVRIRADVKEAAPAKAEQPSRAKAEKAPKATEKPVEEKPAAEEKPAPKGRSPRGKKEEAAPVAAPVAEVPAEDGPAQPEATEEDAERMLEILNRLVDSTGLTLTVDGGATNGRYVSLSIGGDDAGYMVGKNGEVINSLQYLLNIIYNQQVGNGVRATLDGNDYRRKREEQLTVLANRIAAQVEKRGEEAVLDALPAFERRIIHKALGEHTAVMTYSEGEEPNRRVVIAPRD